MSVGRNCRRLQRKKTEKRGPERSGGQPVNTEKFALRRKLNGKAAADAIVTDNVLQDIGRKAHGTAINRLCQNLPDLTAVIALIITGGNCQIHDNALIQKGFSSCLPGA